MVKTDSFFNIRTGCLSLFLLFQSWLPALAASECKASCKGSGSVQVDLEKKCMCIEKENCFAISIGAGGPKNTTQGHGKIGSADSGKRYKTKSSTSDQYDNDALSMGISENTEVGKWIHKTNECHEGGKNVTRGCIAVPCKHWKDVKAQVGKDIDVCGGGGPTSRDKNSSGDSPNSPAPKTGGQ